MNATTFKLHRWCGIFLNHYLIYSFFSDLERDIEERFKARYTLLDKTDQAAIAAAQEAGIPVGDDGELVGESDRQSFGVGPASPTAKPSQSSVVNARKKEAKKAKGKERVR